MKHPDWNRNTIILIIVAALGNFVDVYDLLLFSVIRVKSLRELGVAENDMLSVGAMLINSQMIGMLLGGILWGILGDKKGRLKVLFASIITYSLANIANGLVTNVNTYAFIRFFAGFGLAGELGAGITLVAEAMSKENRGYGTMIVASVGLLGAVLAALIGDLFSWQTSYFIGGGMGLLLLILRIGVLESSLFIQSQHQNIGHGDFFMLFKSRKRFSKYIGCILIALPTWFVVGVLITFAPEFGKAMNAPEPLSASKGILFTYLGISLGDIVAGLLSQYFKTRKKIVIAFLLMTLACVLTFLFSKQMTSTQFYVIAFCAGIATGFWVIFVTIAAEQFGTNLRATVTTTAPNFVRGFVPIITFCFIALKPSVGIINSALIVGVTIISVSLVSAFQLTETFGKDINFIEE